MKPEDFNPVELLHNRLVAKQPQAFYWDVEDRKVHITRENITRDGPWLWPFRSGMRHCMLYQRVMFKYLDILPYPCLGCWKVLVTIPTIELLYEMYKFMLNWKYEECKLGIETRYYVKRDYGAYFYHRTKQEGLKCLKEFRESEIATSGNLLAKLKRGCTEFEIKFGPSDKWDDIITSDEMKLQDMVMSFLNITKTTHVQEVYQRQMTSKLWQTFAAEVTTESITYEE